MKRRLDATDTKAQYFLAGCIFVLWSIGQVVIPWLQTLRGVYADATISITTFAYVALHVAIFMSVVKNVWQLMFDAPKQRTRVFMLLYVYVLIALGVSLYFILTSWFTPSIYG